MGIDVGQGRGGGLAGLMLVAGSGGEAGQAGSRVAARQKEQKVGNSGKVWIKAAKSLLSDT